jgi:hypothetical protein
MPRILATLFLPALLFLAAPERAGAYHLEDSLRGGTAAGNPVGGSFGPDGWTVTSRTDRIWFAIPRLGSGFIEFTMTNLTLDNLVAEDNEMFAMYEAGYGMTEPITYNPDFRNNHYKALLRIYGTDEPGRAGAQKLMWGMCPSGAPGYDGCGCGSFFEEPFGGDMHWNGSPERMRIEWGDGVTRLLRNGVMVHSIDWSESGLVFGPQELHFSLGTSRPDAVGTAALPVGMVFSDLVVDGVEGPLATCAGPVIEDAGVPPPPPPDAGGSAPDGGSMMEDAGEDAGDGGAAHFETDAGGTPEPPPIGGGFDPNSTVVGGCGCHTAGARPTALGPLFALVLAMSAAFGRRRRL